MLFSEKLYTLRKNYSYSQENLAQLSGLSQKTISAYESGKSYPTNNKIYEKLASIFNIPVEDLYPSEDELGQIKSSQTISQVSLTTSKLISKLNKDTITNKIFWNLDTDIINKIDAFNQIVKHSSPLTDYKLIKAYVSDSIYGQYFIIMQYPHFFSNNRIMRYLLFLHTGSTDNTVISDKLEILFNNIDNPMYNGFIKKYLNY